MQYVICIVCFGRDIHYKAIQHFRISCTNFEVKIVNSFNENCSGCKVDLQNCTLKSAQVTTFILQVYCMVLSLQGMLML